MASGLGDAAEDGDLNGGRGRRVRPRNDEPRVGPRAMTSELDEVHSQVLLDPE
jgi:hypothetical protein